VLHIARILWENEESQVQDFTQMWGEKWMKILLCKLWSDIWTLLISFYTE